MNEEDIEREREIKMVRVLWEKVRERQWDWRVERRGDIENERKEKREIKGKREGGKNERER